MNHTQMDLARKIFGILGNAISMCLFLSPIPTFVRIVKNKSVEEYSVVPYLATLMNCLVWVLYGLPMVHPDSTLVITINGAGLAIEIAFLLIFLLFSDRKQRLTIIAVVAAEIAFAAILAAVTMTVFHTFHKRTMFVGIVCCVFNVMMYASPLSVMKMVIKTKSVEYMPFLLSLAAFANAVTWTTYSCLPFDPFIAIPNVIGGVFGVAQLILYGAFYKSTQRIMEERQRQSGKGEVGLSSVTTHTYS
ncbi:PREDICTED: bidirectional sugar transporter SWEET7-like [Tarenaya hassleriana]|uniref:bidirectional sugar transporter SWEET7-like n=1 Tax=Tarenaya hassleriana TaxID=28532 RepID=UPI00053C1733|nr:PREDICTED: bidirectional sugar transporter SWEET7-like [Tarenaya hassleriana]